jgi:hypothetical protein
MRSGWRSLAAIVVVALAGCSAVHQPGAALDAATTAHVKPTLGVRTGTFFNGVGFGKVAPREVFNGGDPTGLVTSITWHGWGNKAAVGTGRSIYVAPNKPVAAGTLEPVRIVAFDLGTCNGRYMYAAVEWYFPQHGQKFDPSQFEDVCIGAYYPLQTGQYQDGTPGTTQYQLTLSGQPSSLSGSLSRISASGKTTYRVFSFHGRYAVNGSLALTSTGPYRTGHTFTGSWGTLDVTLGNCGSYLKSPATPRPSCTFSF